MSEEEIKDKKPNQILEIVNEIFYFNKDIQKQQEGLGLKIYQTKCLVDYQLL